MKSYLKVYECSEFHNLGRSVECGTDIVNALRIFKEFKEISGHCIPSICIGVNDNAMEYPSELDIYRGGNNLELDLLDCYGEIKECKDAVNNPRLKSRACVSKLDID